jgi:glutamine synthetase
VLEAIMPSIRPGPTLRYASVQGEFRDVDNAARSETALCPRSILRRTVEMARSHGLEFLLGFEIEITFMDASKNTSGATYTANKKSCGHAWSSARAIQAHHAILTEIYDTLAYAEIYLEQFRKFDIP